MRLLKTDRACRAFGGPAVFLSVSKLSEFYELIRRQGKGVLTVTTSANAPLTSACAECGGAVSFARPPLQGEVIRCRECTAELEVTDTAPIALTLAPQVEEDWGE